MQTYQWSNNSGWIPAIPLPLHIFFMKQCPYTRIVIGLSKAESSTRACRKLFFTTKAYKAHYGKAHNG